MKPASFPFTIRQLLNAAILLILVLVPFHAFLTVWVASIFGHYTAWRLWDEILLIFATLLATILLGTKPKLWRQLMRQQLVWLILAYAVLELVLGGLAFAQHNVTAKALSYGLIVNLRFPLFFMVCLVAAWHNEWLKNHWRQLLLIPAAVVVAFGMAQYFLLPYDFLRHVGYGATTIFPYETINHNLHYIRIMSTLRGANPLGAYLVIVASALAVLFGGAKDRKWRGIYGVFGLATAAALLLSYSRSAWIGAAVSALIALGLSIKNRQARLWGMFGLAVLLIIGGLAALTLKNNAHFQNIFTHTQSHSLVKISSDQNHVSALKTGLNDVAHQPFGQGPGTAGPASIYNGGQGRVAENYFVQVAQEIGWLGLAIFLLMLCLLAKGLWLGRADPLALTLLASLVGILIVCLFSHAWTDDTLAYVWWGFAGISLGSYVLPHQSPGKAVPLSGQCVAPRKRYK